jgi:signal transduction histidine kinase
LDRGIIRADIRSTIVTQLLVVGAVFVFAVMVAATVVGRIARPLSALTRTRIAWRGRTSTPASSPTRPRSAGWGRSATKRRPGARVPLDGAGREPPDRPACSSSPASSRSTTRRSKPPSPSAPASCATRTPRPGAALEELKQAQDQIVKQEKMASLGALTAGIAHEIKNPLNFVNNFADLSRELAVELKEDLELEGTVLNAKIAADVPDILDQLNTNLSKIKEHGVRADGIVRSMLLHSRGTKGQKQATDVNALARDAVNLAYHGMRANDSNFQVGLDFDFDPAAAAPIEVVPQDLMRAFLNIANNACYAAYHRKAGADGRVGLRTRLLDGAVEVRIRDNGDGIPENVRAKIFEPFFTTKPAGQGTGLGLSICNDIIVGLHGGKMSVETEPEALPSS